MVKIKVHDGTPEGGQSLCHSCRWGHVQQGYRVSEEFVACTSASCSPPRVIPWKVRSCTDYDDRRLPGKREMEQIAWILVTKDAGRTIGFVKAKGFYELHGHDADILP